MKKIVFQISILMLAVVFFSSCEKWIDPEINVNPNSPSDVPLDLLLPSTQGAMFYAYGGDHSRAPSIWMQHQSGVDRQAYAFDRFLYLESDVNNMWNTLNANALKNLFEMRKKSVASESPNYEGVSNVLTAYILGDNTDSWGDLPFYEAHQGEGGNLTPAYQSQQQIYFIIDSLLNAAIPQLGATESLFKPSAAADLNYKGDLNKWKKLAWTMKLRYKLHQSKISGYAEAAAVLNDGSAMFMSENADDFQFKFGTAANARSPRYNFTSNRGDIRAGKYLVDLMNSNDDPRVPIYFKLNPDTLYVGSPPAGQVTNASHIGDFYDAPDANVPLLTYAEFLFMKAEILHETGDKAGAATAYNDGVKASLARHGVTDEAWEATHANEDASSITLKKIMMGKYVALFMHTEVWTDYRRTGFPDDLPAPADAVENAIPRRIPYPLDERLYNPNTPSGLDLSSKLWWDQ